MPVAFAPILDEILYYAARGRLSTCAAGALQLRFRAKMTAPTTTEPTGLPTLGELIDEKYFIERKLGEGGMGAVFAAKHLLTGKRVAMKFLLPAEAKKPHTTARFRREAKFSSWIYRIALNLCRDWMRRERRAPMMQPPEDVDLMDIAVAAEPSESIEDLVARRDLTRLVEQAMAYLPEEQRTAIVLKEYQGLTFQEIADVVGCPLSTVKTRLYQGLTVLRRELAKSAGGRVA